MSDARRTLKRFDEIADFIREGHITLGMTRQQVTKCLGPPDFVGGTSRKCRIPSILKFGDVEFVFPGARSIAEGESQGLLYVYVDECADIDLPIFMLGPRSPADP